MAMAALLLFCHARGEESLEPGVSNMVREKAPLTPEKIPQSILMMTVGLGISEYDTVKGGSDATESPGEVMRAVVLHIQVTVRTLT